jgi:hypothetical protein
LKIAQIFSIYGISFKNLTREAPMKRGTTGLILAAVVLFAAQASPDLFAYDRGGANSTDTGLILRGGLGTGSTMFGFVTDSSSSGDLGSGKGNGGSLGMLLNYHIFAFSADYSRAGFGTMKYKQNDLGGNPQDYETEGGGYFWTMDAAFGIKAFTERGDMGYTHFFVGGRLWRAERTIDSTKIDGVTQAAGFGWNKYEFTGRGFIAGVRDFSTFPLGFFSLVLQSGIWLAQTPMTDLKLEGNGVDFTKDKTLGFGVEFALGVAFERIGFSATAGIRAEVNATSIKYDLLPGVTSVAGAGYALFFVTLTKEFSF